MQSVFFFWCFLIMHECRTRVVEIIPKLRLFAEQYPRHIPCTVFDFTAGVGAIDICRLDETPDSVLDAERIARGNGQLHLHLMRMLDANQDAYLFWPFIGRRYISNPEQS
ncbi:hypothetical protein K438DRAFT_915210 [Mycena galopus ATCC 62051]|nr:hypothetical protein K438DRAFT_915210 [Mycena galopus ATCC 62051]